jgi:uncharacterized protein YggE
MKQVLVAGIIFILVVTGVMGVGRFFGWGYLSVKGTEKLRVIGEARGQQKSQVARVSAGVTVTHDSKEEAVKQTNEAMAKLIEKIKALGIKSDDIKTLGLSMYQEEQMYWEGEIQKRRPTGWRVSNSLEVTLREVERAEVLMEVLTNSGATNVNGPYYSVEEQGEEMDESLRNEAFDDAKRKAEQMAELSGRRLGKVVFMDDGSAGAPVYYGGAQGLGGGGGYEPGTSTVGKSLIVEFELE